MLQKIKSFFQVSMWTLSWHLLNLYIVLRKYVDAKMGEIAVYGII